MWDWASSPACDSYDGPGQLARVKTLPQHSPGSVHLPGINWPFPRYTVGRVEVVVTGQAPDHSEVPTGIGIRRCRVSNIWVVAKICADQRKDQIREARQNRISKIVRKAA